VNMLLGTPIITAPQRLWKTHVQEKRERKPKIMLYFFLADLHLCLAQVFPYRIEYF
jgi:hypothetical protein